MITTGEAAPYKTTDGRIWRCSCFWMCICGKGYQWLYGLLCVCVSEGERGVIHGQALMGAPIPCHYSDPSSPQTLFKPQSALSSVIPLEYICMGGSEIELCHVQANSIITLSKRARWSQTPYWLTPKYINPALHLVHLIPLLSITCLAPHSIYCLFSHWQLG